MLNLNEIAIFVHIVQAGSFAGAARRLNLPPNTLSRRILQLERQLGTRLLQRSTRKLTLTEAGHRLYGQSAGQVGDLLQAARQISGESHDPSGLVRVAAPANFFDVFSIEWIREFLSAHPAVSLDFILNDAVADLIADGIDVAFRGGEMPDSSLVARKLDTGRLALAASPSYLRRRGVPASFQSLAEHDCIRASKPPGPATWRLNGPEGEVSVKVAGRFSANTAQSQMHAAIAGLGICLLPGALLEPGLRTGELVEVLPDYGRRSGGFYVVYPSRKQVPRAVTAFVNMAASKINERVRTLQAERPVSPDGSNQDAERSPAGVM